jgi:uncharacterized protein YdaU (DUF1376 family)
MERLRWCLKKGMKGVEIQLRLGVTASCIAEQRRRYNRELKENGKALLPPAGAGAAYSGLKLSREKKREVEAQFLEGFGTAKVAATSGVSKTSCTRIRNCLIRKLKRDGMALMSVLPYHKRYHSDALAGFMPLTLEERGAYQTLLDMMYDRGGPLIDNERLLAGYMNCSLRKWRQVREQLIAKHKITITKDGTIINSRARKEIENATKTHRKLIESGAKGGRTRVENEKKTNEINGTDEASLEQPSSHPQAIRATYQKPDTRKRRKNPQTPIASGRRAIDHGRGRVRVAAA